MRWVAACVASSSRAARGASSSGGVVARHELVTRAKETLRSIDQNATFSEVFAPAGGVAGGGGAKKKGGGGPTMAADIQEELQASGAPRFFVFYVCILNTIEMHPC